MEAIVTMLAVKFLREQEKREYVFTQDELKEMIASETVRLELTEPQQPFTTNIRCSIITLAEAQKMQKAVQQTRKVVDRTKNKRT